MFLLIQGLKKFILIAIIGEEMLHNVTIHISLFSSYVLEGVIIKVLDN